MTVASNVVPALKRPDAVPSAAHARRVALLIGISLMLMLALLYGILQNPYWVRHGDSELLLSVARNLARGQGYKFNGEPVAIAPPGWPLLLAGALKVTARLLWLKLIPMLSVLGFLAVSYTVLLRFTTPLVAALCVLTAGLLEPVFSLSYLFFSDGFFSLVAMTAVWLALRISDENGRGAWWRILLLAVLCAASVAVRWAGAPFFALVGGALLSGELWPRLNRRWIAFGLCAVSTVATLFSLRAALRPNPAELDPRYDQFVSTGYDLVNEEEEPGDYADRAARTGQWISGLLWQPAVAAKVTRLTAQYIGWAVLILTLPVLWRSVRRREWLWPGALVYIGVLCLNWPSPMSRYIVPTAPLVLAAAYLGMSAIFSVVPRRLAWSGTFAMNVFFASILTINGLLFLIEASINRSKHFYDRFQAGVHKELIDAAWYLNQQPRQGFEVAISGLWANFDQAPYFTDGYRRALNFLTDRSIVTVPRELCREPDRELVQWLRQHNVRYYLYQPPIYLLRHFHPRSRGGIPLTREDIAWRLYEIRDGQAMRVKLEATEDWPKEVPGM